MKRSMMTLPLLLVAAAMFVATDAQAAPPADAGRSEHERVVRYWTPDRVDHARPREIGRQEPVFNAASPAAVAVAVAAIAPDRTGPVAV